MKKIMNIAWKDIRNRFSSPSELLFFLILPILFTFLLGGGFDRLNNEVELPTLAVVDQDASALSGELISKLEQEGTFIINGMESEDAQDALEDGDVLTVLEIPEGFESDLREGNAGALEIQVPEDSEGAQIIEQSILVIAEELSRSITAAHASVAERERQVSFESPKEREQYFEVALTRAQSAFENQPSRVTITVPQGAQEAQDMAEALTSHHNAGQLITWVFIPLLATSAVLADERTIGTLRRLLTTPTSKPTFLLGTFTGQLIPAFLQMGLLLAFGALVMGVEWGHSIPALIVLLFSFGLAAVALGTMLGTLVKTTGQASNLSIMAGMAIALLGGCWWPAEMFPGFMRTAGKILPTSWALQGLTDIAIRGFGITEILPEAGVLLGFAAIFFTIGVLRFRYE
ncbi:MAG: ABC transporter permease [Anaerolineales bacterium]|nr:ABC transporter permease [Anaerolineales bacterium]